jgi:hypothetical protein
MLKTNKCAWIVINTTSAGKIDMPTTGSDSITSDKKSVCDWLIGLFGADGDDFGSGSVGGGEG